MKTVGDRTILNEFQFDSICEKSINDSPLYLEEASQNYGLKAGFESLNSFISVCVRMNFTCAPIFDIDSSNERCI